MENTLAKGFSNRASHPDFIGELVKDRKKTAKKSLIKAILFLLPIIAAAAVLAASNAKPDISAALAYGSIAAFPVIPVFGILFIVSVCAALGAFRSVKKAGADTWDGVIREKQQWTTKSYDEHGYETEHENYKITIQKDSGGTYKLTDDRARAIMPYTAEGDKVRFHAGFAYPIELYDKSKANVCVFCGAGNPAENRVCDRCGKPLLTL